MSLPPDVEPDHPVYAAEEQALLELAEDAGEDERHLDADQLGPWLHDVMERAGWGDDARPTLVFDVPDDSNLTGWHEGATGTIHLHPKLLRPSVVLHEVAHWLRPRDGHGPQFAAVLLGLYHAGIGEDAAGLLERAYREHDVEVDLTWM